MKNGMGKMHFQDFETKEHTNTSTSASTFDITSPFDDIQLKPDVNNLPCEMIHSKSSMDPACFARSYVTDGV